MKWSNYLVYRYKCHKEQYKSIFKQNMKIRKFLLFFLILSFIGCRTIQPISTDVRNDSVRIEYRLDSVYLYERDSIYIDRYRSNDTIYLTKEKWLIRYKDKEVAVHDTIYRDREQIEVVQVKVTPRWAWWSLIACIALVAGIVIRIILRIYAKR